jgi:hypothetical protein
MFGNDQYGDCTIAGAAHMYEPWDILAGDPFTVTLDQVYSAYNIFDPGFQTNPNADQGANLLDVLNRWRQKGLFNGDLCWSYASISPTNHALVQQGATIFGGLYIGVELPLTAQTQTIWDVVADGSQNAQPGSWGGHCVCVVKYDPTYVTVVTWGALLQMTWAFWDMYIDEVYVVLPNEYQAKTINGFNWQAYVNDLESIGGQPSPVSPTPAPTPPTPTPPAPPAPTPSGCNPFGVLASKLLPRTTLTLCYA